MMFFKKKHVALEEVAPYYWEEKSYMMVIPKEENEDILKLALERLEKAGDINLIENHYDVENNVFNIKLKYDKEEYEVGMYMGGISVPEYYVYHNILFTDEEKRAILSAKRALTIFMKFNENHQKSYQLELKLAVTLVPDQIGVMDESAERMLPAKWVNLTANSKVLPNPKNLFTIQAVKGDKDNVWLHTHGLNRCGVTELEILESDSKNYQSHYNLINTYAMYLLDKKNELEPRYNGAYIGRLINDEPVVATCVSWTEGINEYKKLDLGGIVDRKEGHNSKTSIIFLYQSEEDENNKVLKKVSIYNDIWSENPIFFISDKETKRMKELAIERFSYIKEAFKNKENQILIKVGLPLKEEGNFEHIWFELLEIKGNKFKAKLTQEPYDIEDIHTGDEAWYTKDDITDWIIYTKEFTINPDNVYLLKNK